MLALLPTNPSSITFCRQNKSLPERFRSKLTAGQHWCRIHSTMETDTTEARALRLSPIGYLIFGLLGVAFFLITRSEAILLDGIYSLISLVLAVVALRVSRIADLPGSSRYHFGYAHLEPLINVGRIALILGVDAFALFSAVSALLSGGRELNTGPALIYGVLSAPACLAMSALQRRTAKIVDSPILRVDARNWFIDGAISSGVGLAFLLGFFMERSSMPIGLPIWTLSS